MCAYVVVFGVAASGLLSARTRERLVWGRGSCSLFARVGTRSKLCYVAWRVLRRLRSQIILNLCMPPRRFSPIHRQDSCHQQGMHRNSQGCIVSVTSVRESLFQFFWVCSLVCVRLFVENDDPILFFVSYFRKCGFLFAHRFIRKLPDVCFPFSAGMYPGPYVYPYVP